MSSMFYIRTIIITMMIVSFSCHKSSTDKKLEAEVSVAPTDSMYLRGNWYINDTIPARIAFDTGSYGISITEDTKRRLGVGDDSIRITQGNFNYTYTKDHIDIRQDELNPTILIGWQLLEDKIVELSTKKGVLWTLENTENLENYQSLDYTIFETAHDKIIIPVTIFIQGKEKILKIMFDTGLSGSLIGFEDALMDLDYSNSTQSSILSVYGKENNIKTLEVDSLKIGNFCVEKNELLVVNFMKSVTNGNEVILNGIIGTKILDNFRIVIDFRNQKMFLKYLDI